MGTHLNEAELAKRWGMSPRTLQRWRQEGRGPVYLKLGGHVVYPLADVEVFEQKQRRNDTAGGSTKARES
jgi:predicted site-specific integrase-resolvase